MLPAASLQLQYSHMFPYVITTLWFVKWTALIAKQHTLYETFTSLSTGNNPSWLDRLFTTNDGINGNIIFISVSKPFQHFMKATQQEASCYTWSSESLRESACFQMILRFIRVSFGVGNGCDLSFTCCVVIDLAVVRRMPHCILTTNQCTVKNGSKGIAMRQDTSKLVRPLRSDRCSRNDPNFHCQQDNWLPVTD